MVKAKVLKQFRKAIDKINKIKNPLPDKFPENLTYKASNEMSESQIEDCMKLFQANMSEMYKDSSWGLDLENKRSELTHRNARFLLLSDKKDPSKIAAYCHFRFCLDDDNDPSYTTLYVYEMQVAKTHQRQGIGKTIMELCEKMAQEAKVEKVMLTVFTKNKGARDFYEALGYHNDATCPSKHGQYADYEILSKETATIEWILL